MELDITRFFNEAAPRDYSASVAEIGNHAGAYTWRAAMDDADGWQLMADSELPEFREYVRGFGAWSAEEIAGWSAQECNALLIQMIAGDIRETPGMTPASWDWQEYQAMCEAGAVAGRMFEAANGRIYYYIGN